jgi:hypothetical protein
MRTCEITLVCLLLFGRRSEHEAFNDTA